MQSWSPQIEYGLTFVKMVANVDVMSLEGITA